MRDAILIALSIIILAVAVILTQISIFRLTDRIMTLEYCLNTPLDVRDHNKCR